MENIERQFYSIREMRTILACSYTKAQDLAHMFLMQGKCIKVGRIYRISKPAFDTWIMNQMDQKEGA